MQQIEYFITRTGFLALISGVVGAAMFGGSRVHVASTYQDVTVKSVSESGKVWKTWELDAVGDDTKKLRYSIPDPELANRLQEIPPGKKVRVHYWRYLTPWPPKGETRQFVVRVDSIPEPAK